MRGATTELQQALLTADGAAQVLGLSRSAFYRLHSSGRVPQPVRLGGAVRWRAEELRAWVRAACPPRARWDWPGD